MTRIRLMLRRDIRMSEIHPFYESHRGAMEAGMRQRLDLAETMLTDDVVITEADTHHLFI